MHHPGHYGGSLAIYPTVRFVLTAFGVSELAIFGGDIVAGGAQF